MVASQFCYPGTDTLHFGWQLTAIAIMTCGTVFLMWLGEQIDEYGIGNGISLLIMASILAQMPRALLDLRQNMTTELSGSSGEIGPDKLIVLAALFIAVVFRRGVHHARSAAYSDAERETCSRSTRLRRNQAISAVANQSGGCDADHFRQQPADAARSVVRCDGWLVCSEGTSGRGRWHEWISADRQLLRAV